MRLYLLPPDGAFRRANLHCHTTVSDGAFTPPEIKSRYKAAGYEIVAFSDHEVPLPHTDLKDEAFLPITSYEIAFNKPGLYDNHWTPTHHLNLFSKEEFPRRFPYICPGENWWGCKFFEPSGFVPSDFEIDSRTPDYSLEGIQKLIDRANARGFLVSYNHPGWSLQNPENYVPLDGVWGVECYNTGCHRGGYVLDNSELPLYNYLRAGKDVFPLAQDDNHGPGSEFGGWTMIKSPTLEYSDVMGALERGEFYASTGPSIDHLWIENGTVHLESPDGVLAFLTTESRFQRRFAAPAGERLVARFDIKEWLQGARDPARPHSERPFFRISVYDGQGRWALTRGFRTDQLPF